MSQTPTQGPNRTGIATNEDMAAEMIAGTLEFPPSSSGPADPAGEVRIEYARTAENRALGSVPAPTGLKAKAKAAMQKLKGNQPTLLIDKLGERLAFERTGTRLYQALVSKHEADNGYTGGPERADLMEILNEEHRHFSMLCTVIQSMGGDPTAMTPSADVAGVTAMGLLAVITDARTTLLQGLEAIMIAELADREGWEVLIELAGAAGKNDLVVAFEGAAQIEEEHIMKVRGWIAAAQDRTVVGG
jgi:rubrerythrin